MPNRLVVGDSQYRCRILWSTNHQGMYQYPPYVVSQCRWLGPKVHLWGTAAPTGTYEQHTSLSHTAPNSMYPGPSKCGIKFTMLIVLLFLVKVSAISSYLIHIGNNVADPCGMSFLPLENNHQAHLRCNFALPVLAMWTMWFISQSVSTIYRHSLTPF